MIRRRQVLAMLGAMALLMACEDIDQPHEPAWGKERCGHCSMVVGDRRFAGQAISERGERLFFDDLGCLASYELQHAHLQHAWVRSESQWLTAAGARFNSDAHSPMDYGFVVATDGALDWSAVRSATERSNQRAERQ